ncbi:MAG: hypothetical protein LBL15_08760 [Oscillospiraceae bacterium]|jgi:hypothetical protein|nr:hypothetical protein [Oscillospiraceae bacterium]
MPGDVIPCAVREIKNTSIMPLTDFYWRDALPVDAARLSHVITGFTLVFGTVKAGFCQVEQPQIFVKV